MGSHKSRDDEIYEQGVHDGQQANALDQFSHNLVEGYTLDPRTNAIYNAGYEYGLAHRPVENERADDEGWWATSDRPSPPRESGSSDDSSEVLGKLVGYGIVIFVIVWLVVAVVIPLLLLDIPIIAVGVAFLRPGSRRFVLPLAVLASGYLFVDYNQGWLSREFAINAPFLAGLIKPLLYANLCAALGASYLLLREYLMARYPWAQVEGNQTRFRAALVAGLALVGTIVVSGQELHDHRGDPPGSLHVVPVPSFGDTRGTSSTSAPRATPRPTSSTQPHGENLGGTNDDLFVLRALIDDPDGYTNVRELESATSTIIGRVMQGEQFLTYRQEGNWWLVRTRAGVIGYMHVSRIRLLP